MAEGNAHAARREGVSGIPPCILFRVSAVRGAGGSPVRLRAGGPPAPWGVGHDLEVELSTRVFMKRLSVVTLLLVGLAGLVAAAERPVPPREAPARMTLPDGFRATLFAGEPDVVQPIAFTFDDRGRMWVVECLSYPNWTDKAEGGDRVTIYHDADGDGRFDKRTVFWDKGRNLSGIALGFGGVWLCSTPELVFVPDRDGDDKPDGPPQALLDGWDLKAKHNVFN